MNITSTGIAVALAVVLGVGLILFGPALFTPFAGAEPTYVPADSSLTQSTTTESKSIQTSMEIPESLPTTLTATDIVVGTGVEATPGSTVHVLYTGMLPDGKVFDSTANRGNAPFSFALGAGMVIKGWDAGVAGMKEGGKRRLIIPADMAYGAGGVPQAGIPGGATLIFDVELLKVGQ
ncbi:MAG: FKBP-type peptidyl-prolyl cis-trans isomerase [Candidatus Pacebacteria bacterium]|nr:FKBP-type peptidyl-prolyl cis-trans isomerase [Candidatus Paceibacterota bacterium]